MAKAAKNLEEIKRSYAQALHGFQKFKKSFNKNMNLALSEDAAEITKSFDNFNALISQWDTNSELRTVGIENFVASLNRSLGEIIDAHKNLATRASTMKDPSIIQHIKGYLSNAITSITTLFTAVKEFVGNLSQKTSKNISTSFNNFKESLKKIKVLTSGRTKNSGAAPSL